MTSSPQQARRIWFWSVVAAVLFITLHIVEDLLGTVHLSTWAFALLILTYSMWIWIRQHALLRMTIGVMAATLGMHYELAMHMQTMLSRQSWTLHLIGFAVLLLFSLPASLLQRKRTRTWYRWLFDRACEGSRKDPAEPGKDSTNDSAGQQGDDYSATPVMVRHTQYSMKELRRFASFLSKRHIAVSQWNNSTLTLFLPGEQYLYRRRGFDPSDVTKVTFEENGDMYVHISRMDCQPYLHACPYSKLCGGIGNVMFDLLQRQRQGEEDLILREVHDDTRQAQSVLIIIGGLVFIFAAMLYLDVI
ncbi:hypothetical protein KQI65_00720 [bacterium]|nr:hypothetical protein [bacterium]